MLATRSLLEGKDVVLAAETGSGKTLAYLGPIASKLLSHKLSSLSAHPAGTRYAKGSLAS